jgi:ADP-ribose pyrophosphatase YjhB (NUDIX family)
VACVSQPVSGEPFRVLSFPGAARAAARPVLAASVAVFRPDGRVLLATRTKPPAADVWSLPGGKVEAGETLEEAALRELSEEVGVTARIIGFNRHVEIIQRDEAGQVSHHFVVASFVGEWLAGEPAAGPEAGQVRWVDPFRLGGLATTRDLAAVLRAAHALREKAR